MNILLTNDDGVDAPGIDALYDELSAIAEVTVVAPADNQSGAGRTNSHRVAVDDHERGLVVHGTPCDCVAVGLQALDSTPELVVSGCNAGPNFGAHKLDRSGTVGAAKEAVYLGVPGIAISAYDPVTGGLREFEREDFVPPARVARYLVEHAGSIGSGTYLNVNAPTVMDDARIQITRPTRDFGVRIEKNRDEDGFAVVDQFYDPLRGDRPEELDDPKGTDRRALADGEISVSPLGVGHELKRSDGLEGVAAEFEQ
ncbi:5'-nucleotidase /3'-nucleotidase /exopolyphosphatase [Haladaptatus litoreus]|uniref:5'-nucleotidase SurE n=1 Tax=Haladaptatus litoreus TaxID=553468 RepID=A0A1N7B7C8_9EURY|nr:5'/3'-nucleotidase SurE [Haladaptatus litoreus]SIR47270.1 5'-nucleotidase /3'-nucleotidase /exopolyphosphatase [Haladaptatus litoreus]